MKISAEGISAVYTKFCTYENIPLYSIPCSRERVPMGRRTLHSRRRGGGRSFECFRIQPQRMPTFHPQRLGGKCAGGGGRRGPSELTELEQPHDMIVLLNSQHLALTLYTRKAITNLHACTNKSLEAVKTTFV